MSNEWEEVTDELGRVYYYNKSTQETSWTKPLVTKSEWKTYTTEDGREYYHNQQTGETTWEIPEVLEKQVEKDSEDNVEQLINDETHNTVNSRSDEAKNISPLDLELEQKKTKLNELIETPQFKSFQEAEAAFLELLKTNNVDSTWSFQAVISKFIKNPIYWAIPDALHRKRLYDEYLVQKLKDELSNKTAVIENFEKNFLEVLKDFEKKGYIKYNTRWSAVKNILISEENPIFKNTVLSDNEVSKIYENFVATLKDTHEELIKQQKEQALTELKSYLIQINPNLVSESENWEQLYKSLLSDARFRANKHFTVLSKLDILELYTTEIYPKIMGELQAEIEVVEKKNHRSDRKARDNFKEFISQHININANSLFKELFPRLENEDCFIELCGRNGSSPLDFFWDIVDEKYQLMKLKKDLVENTLLGLKNESNFDYDSILEDKEIFVKTLANLKDERLSAFDFNISSESQEDNELEIIYDNLKRENDLRIERMSSRLKIDLTQRTNEFAQWLALNYDQYNIIKVDTVEAESSEVVPISVLFREDQNPKYILNSIEKEELPTILRSNFENIQEFRDLDTVIKAASDKGITTEKGAMESSIQAFVSFLNDRLHEKSAYNRKRQIREDHGDAKRFKQDNKDFDSQTKSEAPKHNPVLLNY